MADKVYRRIGPPISGSSALWFSTSIASGIIHDEFFGVPPTPPAGINPTTIMGANAIWYGDAAQPGLGQNIDGSGAVADGDPVRFLPGLAGPDLVATDVARNVVYRANAGDPYLEGVAGASNLRGSLTRSGDFYSIFRGRMRGTGSDRECFHFLHANPTSFYTGNNINISYLPFGLDYLKIESSSGEAYFDVATVTRGTWVTLEYYVTGSNAFCAIDGGAFEPGDVALSAPTGTTSYLDLFGSIDSGVPSGAYDIDITRGAILDAIPDSTQRAALLTWATSGDTGGPAGGLIKVWSGSAWVEKPIKVWTGSAWVQKPLKFWNGSAFVST